MFSWFDFLCKAEIVKVTSKWSYVYLELIEYNNEWVIVAKMKGCIFDEYVCSSFLQETGLNSVQELTWMKVLFHGKFSFHKEYHLSIIIDKIDAYYTLWQLQKKQNDILVELEKLGIKDHNKQTRYGFPPYTLAIVSSLSSAWLHDFQSVIDQGEYNISYQFYYCAVHGNNATSEVLEQLHCIDADIRAGEKVDAVLIMRWGGESSGMLWQNDFEIAKAICTMPIPVMIAVGHTKDTSVLEEIAHYIAKTPTDAAYAILWIMQHWQQQIENVYDEIVDTSQEHIRTIETHIEERHKGIMRNISQYMNYTRLQIDSRYATICAISPKKLLQSWYALLMNDDQYMTKSDVVALKEGDLLDIQVYDLEFRIQVIKKK